MTDRRRERQRQQQREALERALGVVEREGLDALSLPDLGEAVSQRALLARLPDPEALFFQDHPELMEGLQEALSQRHVHDALLAYAEHLEGDRDLWLRRLEAIHREPRLRARQAQASDDLRRVLGAHFQRWGAADPAGRRATELEAWAVAGVLEGALDLWRLGSGRPTLPVLVHEALTLLWPALYPHQRR